MSESFDVDVAQLHQRAAKVRAVRDQLAAVKRASSAIAQDDAAYGLLCQWIAAILERRHQGQDELYGFVEDNLKRAAEAIATTADEYDTTDSTAHQQIMRAGGLG
ncbi:hypothetical protein GCM10010435_07850 [Winogradskya consettensis]|uniref:Excreted virulence factor EspC (Type VII ESX diderm) n=1 Tax=Winogradskya consettensis TaxID=113560 RepID=A0A919SIM4_9ACTN|nr:type VII secretion target [Actinoplanes consettensis]GIM72721.1 hypothetical protein Aco04nite_31640 [Actinoplanes consettensis]